MTFLIFSLIIWRYVISKLFPVVRNMYPTIQGGLSLLQYGQSLYEVVYDFFIFPTFLMIFLPRKELALLLAVKKTSTLSLFFFQTWSMIIYYYIEQLI